MSKKVYNIHITNPEAVVNNEGYTGFHLEAQGKYGEEWCAEQHWPKIGEVELDFDPFVEVCRDAALAKIVAKEKRQLAEHEKIMQRYNDERQKLLALEAPQS